MADGSSKAIKIMAIGLGLALVVIGLFVAREIYLNPPGQAEAEAAPAEAPVAPDAQAAPAPATPEDPDARYTIQRSDGGVLLTNQPGAGGTIQEKDGQVLLSAKGEPGPELASAPAAAPAGSPAPVAAPADPDVALRIAVREYLDRVASLQAGPAGLNPRKYADSLVNGIAKGDRSEFDKLLEEVERVRDEAKAISPPEPCREHHQHLVSITQESVDLLEELAEALDRQDMAKLEFITRKSRAIQAETKRMELLEEKLRKRYEAY